VKTSTSSVQFSANPTTVSALTTVSMSVQNFNPLREHSTLKITIPVEFDMTSNELGVTTYGGDLDTDPNIQVDTDERTLIITAFNVVYLEQYRVSYFYITGLVNPSNVKRTSSFGIEFLDQTLRGVEYVDQGISFQATTGSFVSATMSVDNYYINAENA
jgi:hypothetical protein